MLDLMDTMHLTERFKEYSDKYGDFALAWVCAKLVEPVRFALTLGITPSVKRKLESMKVEQQGKREENGQENEKKTNENENVTMAAVEDKKQ